jgi:flagellum-specific ATP synthase
MAGFLSDAQKRVQVGNNLAVRGTLTRLTGLVLEAVGIRVPVGSQCLVTMKSQAPVWPKWSASPTTGLF